MRTAIWMTSCIVIGSMALMGCDKDTPSQAVPSAQPATAPQTAKAPPPAQPAKSDPAGWTVLAPEGKGFRVAMPGAPQSREEKRTTDQGTVDTTVWMTVTPAGGAYSVGAAIMPESVAEILTPSSEFDDVRTKLLVKVAGKLLAEKNETQAGTHIRTFSLTGNGPKGESLFRVRLARLDNRTYQLMTVHPVKDNKGPDAKAFFDSFALTK